VRTILQHNEVIRLVTSAHAAASVLNTQPWIFEVTSDGVSIEADESRSLPITDPEGRQRIMSCGCAALNLRLAVAALPREPRLEAFPEGDAGRQVARVHIGRARVPTTEETRMYAAIPRRRTNRRPFSPEPPAPAALEHLQQGAEAEGAVLTVIDPQLTERVADMVHEADRRQQADPALRAEVAHWIAPQAARGEGLTTWALGPVPRGGEAITRDFGFGSTSRGRQVSDFETRPTLLLLSTAGDGRREWLTAGLALQRVHLLATTLGLATSYLGQVLEIPDLRAALVKEVGQPGNAQMLLRMGHAAPSPPTPRRPVDSLIHWEPRRI
jgi:hypothetical protein